MSPVTGLPAVQDFDFHPDEDEVRVFVTEPSGVLHLSDDAYVSADRYGDLIVWHYAFARHWFKVNLTMDLDGRITEFGGDVRANQFAFNCDIATPMRRQDAAVYAVDLFADVLVQADGTTYEVCDLEQFEQAQASGLIVPGEALGARHGLDELTGIIASGELAAFLFQTCPFGNLDPPFASAPRRAPVSEVPLLSRQSRTTWAERTKPRDAT